MPSYFEIIPPFQQFIDGNGNPLSGGKVYTYAAGTSTPKTTYRESDGITGNSNPIVLDSSGYCPYGVWGTTGAYKIVLATSADVVLRTRDNVMGINDITQTGWVLLSSQEAAGVSSIDFTQFSSTYSVYRIEFAAVVPATDTANLYMRTSSNGGSSFDSGGSDYQYAYSASSSAASVAGAGSAGAAQIQISGILGNATGEHVTGTMNIQRLTTSNYKSFTWHAGAYLSTPTYFSISGAGMRLSSSTINAVRFLMSSGNISAGTFKLFGLLE